MTNPYAPPPAAAAQLTPQEERSWSVGTHVATAAITVISSGLLGFVAALVVFLLYKDRGPFVRFHVANALNIQLTGLLWALGVVILGILTLGVGWLLIFAVPIMIAVLHGLGALAASRGEWTTPPLTIRFVR